MKIHHNDAVLTPPCGPGGAILHAGRIIALIAEEHHGAVVMGLFRVFHLVLGKNLLIGLRPDPLDLFLQGPQIRYIVHAMTGIDAISASFFCRPALFEIHRHRPPSLRQVFSRR